MDARLREGIGLFNKGCFFECHEVLEQFYQKTEDTNKPFLEGLIQLAAAFRIFSDFGETRGAVRMIRQALIRFEPYQPSFLQVRVEELCTAMEAWAQLAESADRSVSISSIPKIQTQLFNFLP
jgi:predicted metal-dependent hydrolase